MVYQGTVPLEEFGESYGTVTIVSGLGPECVLNGRVKVDDLNTESGIQKLNQVANVIDNMSDEELGLLGGALSIERAKNLDVVLRIIDSLDQYEIYPEIKTSEALGRLLAGPSSPIGLTFFPKQVLPYLDYEKIASEQAKTFGGGYTLYGYTRKKRNAGATALRSICLQRLTKRRVLFLI